MKDLEGLHRPDGPYGFGLYTTEDDVVISDRHGCEIILFPAEALLIARSIVARYGPDWPDRQ